MMAHKLGMEVIAGGIETEMQLNILKKVGCDFG
jgi:EAL domain-containing protein (putative c-di-GMP-specific phosphodiesterase class I)